MSLNEIGLHPCTPRLGSRRLHLMLNDADHAKISRGRRWQAIVTDQNTGAKFKLRGASCGLSHCMCDAVVVAIDKPQRIVN
jgi:hypothetical protein